MAPAYCCRFGLAWCTFTREQAVGMMRYGSSYRAIRLAIHYNYTSQISFIKRQIRFNTPDDPAAGPGPVAASSANVFLGACEGYIVVRARTCKQESAKKKKSSYRLGSQAAKKILVLLPNVDTLWLLLCLGRDGLPRGRGRRCRQCVGFLPFRIEHMKTTCKTHSNHERFCNA